MSGDDLIDLLRVRNGQICYWPNTEYENFGAKMIMDNSPWFAESDEFNRQFIQVGDIDGSGTSDIMYFNHTRVDLYLNQFDNGFSNRKWLSIFSLSNNFSTIAAVDLLDTGTICLV